MSGATPGIDHGGPCVGIFWCHDNKVFGVRALASSLAVVEGRVDLDCGHAAHWDDPLCERPRDAAFEEFEYVDFPRGRVIFDVVHTLFIVYADRRILTSRRRQAVIEFFRLPPHRVRWRLDPHYVDLS